MASLSSKTINGKSQWRLSFRHDGKQRTLRLGAIKESQATTVRARIDDLIRSCRLNIDPQMGTQEWIQSAQWSLVERLEAMGLTAQIADLIQQRRIKEHPELFADAPKQLTLIEFSNWYVKQRKAKCENSTIRKVISSLNQLCDYCREHETIELVADIDAKSHFVFSFIAYKPKQKPPFRKT